MSTGNCAMYKERVHTLSTCAGDTGQVWWQQCNIERSGQGFSVYTLSQSNDLETMCVTLTTSDFIDVVGLDAA